MDKKMYELTNPQKSIWFTEEFYKGTPIENITGSVIIKEQVNFKLLDKAIKLFVKNNDSFRLKFVNADNKIEQVLEDFKDFNIETINVINIKDVEVLEKNLSKTPFDIFNSLYTIKILKFPNNNGGFTINIHHLIADAWTSGLIIDGITNIYSELLKDVNKTDFEFPSYLEYIKTEQEYLNSEKFIKDKTFWNELYTEIPELACIPSINSNSQKKSCNAKRKVFSLPKETFTLINNFAKKYKASPFNFFMGVFGLYLGRVSNLDEFVIGTPILNRSNFKEKHTTGMFISTVPFKITINHEVSFADFISKISTNFFDVFRHQKYPYQYLLEDLRKENSSTPNLYDVMLSYQNMRTTSPSSEINFSSTWISPEYISDSLDIHLFDINDTGSINIAYDYQTEKYCIDDIYSLHARILNIINQILEDEIICLKDIEIVTPDEKEKILYEFNNTKMEYPKDKTISELFEEQVEKTPDNIAVVFEDQKLTYKELNEKANSLANYLLQHNIKSNEIISIFLDKSLEMIIAILGILKAGCAYLPIDIGYPNERIEYMLQDSTCKFILTSTSLSNLIPPFVKPIFIDLDKFDNNFKSIKNNIVTPNANEHLAYIMYTSGSTGNPKGVIIEHKSIIRLVKNTNFITFKRQERIIQTGSIVFDACTFEIWASLLNGFELYIIKKADLLDPISLEKYLIKNKITIMWLTSPLFNQLCENNPNMFKTIDYLLTGGDVLSPKHINMVKKQCPNLTIINGYGPTENTTFSTCFIIKDTYIKSIPIGFPIANSTCYIVSKDLKLLPIGVPGELVVGGDGVGKGYLNNIDYTNQKFIKDCFAKTGLLYKTGDLVKWREDGSIDFIGRIDNQVKIRGFRIELNEITLNLNNFPNIKEAITIVKKINNEKVICSYFSSETTINIPQLKDFLKKHLPVYSLPTYLIQLQKIPINANGKIEIKKLPEPQTTSCSNSIIPARNSEDEKIINILKELLNTNNISIDNSFFDLGGDSLSAINLCTRIYNEFNVQVFVKDILENPVVMDLSDLIASKNNFQDITTIPRVKKSNYYPVSSAQKRMYFSSSIAGNNSILYNIPGGVILDKLPDIKKLENCLNILMQRHESFRTYFELEEDNVVQKIQDEIKFKLEVCKDIINFKNLKQKFDNFVKPFDLSKAPLFRVELVKLDNKKVALFIDMHHIISDGTSLGIFIKELCNLYNDKTLNKLNISYKDFSAWENNRLNSRRF